MNYIPVTARVSPIRSEAISLVVEPGLTVAQIVDQVLVHPSFPISLAPVVQVTINEVLVARNLWHLLKPKLGTRVKVLPLYQGGGGNNKVVFQALVLVATAIAYSIPGIGAIAGPLVGLAGSAALALFAPKPPSAKGGDGFAQLSASGFTGNNLAPYDQIPTVVGKIRAAPYLLTQPWTRLQGSDNIVRGVIGLSGHIEWSEIRVNGALANDAEQVEFETFNGDGGPPVIELFSEVGLTDSVGLELRKHDLRGTHTSTYSMLTDQVTPLNSIPKFYAILSKDTPDNILINLQFPAGMYESDATGSDRNFLIRIRMRLIGETAWINLPELLIDGPRIAPFNFTVRLSWDAEPLGINTSRTWQNASDEGSAAGQASWTANAYFGAATALSIHAEEELDAEDPEEGGEISNTVTLYLNETGTPFPKGKYEIQIKRGAVTKSDDWDLDADEGVEVDPFLYVDPGGGGLIRVAPRQAEMVDTCIFHSLTSLWNEEPVQAPNTAVIAFQLKNTQVDHITVIAESWALVHVPT
ncbi:MAG: hypothetical protein L0Y56_00045, partial [Nitrospira sp.]|nr:hypothetical protein [Nitrospira sp.]